MYLWSHEQPYVLSAGGWTGEAAYSPYNVISTMCVVTDSFVGSIPLQPTMPLHIKPPALEVPKDAIIPPPDTAYLQFKLLLLHLHTTACSPPCLHHLLLCLCAAAWLSISVGIQNHIPSFPSLIDDIMPLFPLAPPLN